MSSTRLNLSRHSGETQIRSSSAPESEVTSLSSDLAPESADDMAEWVRTRQEPMAAELEGSAVEEGA